MFSTMEAKRLFVDLLHPRRIRGKRSHGGEVGALVELVDPEDLAGLPRLAHLQVLAGLFLENNHGHKSTATAY